MRYHNPNSVTSPKEFISNITVLFDGGEEDVSFAKIIWEGRECIGIRWNVARREWDELEKINGQNICVGMPSSHGYPVWFILPNSLFDNNSKLFKAIKSKT